MLHRKRNKNQKFLVSVPVIVWRQTIEEKIIKTNSQDIADIFHFLNQSFHIFEMICIVWQEGVAGRQINRVVCHPTLPLTMTAHEDRFIRFFDNTSGKMVHSMVAHLDAVTSLAVDPNGLYLLSGSEYCYA